ncbi:MAG: aldo/keto reductase [Candidatus Latescibacteria bacterium]|nr:aldo/keto reductase [Candidatus Latescibacterota bacterium]
MKRRSFLKGIGAAATTTPFAGCTAISRKNKYMNYVPKGTISRRTLGNTGMQASILGFGSHLKKELIADPELRDRLIKLGYEGGINIFDVYDHSGYKQFKPMGKSLKGFRKEVLVSLCIVKSTEDMQEEINGALGDFFTDYIDLYRLYTVNDDRINILEKNKKAGKIRAIGVVSHDVPTMKKYIDQYGDVLDYVMIVYNFHHNIGSYAAKKGYPPNDYTALLPLIERTGLGVLGIKPMGSDAMIALARKKKFFKDRNANVAQAMLRHVYEKVEIDTAMPAMNSMEEVVKNLESAYNPKLSSYEKGLLTSLSSTASSTKSAYLPEHYKWLENWTTRVV